MSGHPKNYRRSSATVEVGQCRVMFWINKLPAKYDVSALLLDPSPTNPCGVKGATETMDHTCGTGVVVEYADIPTSEELELKRIEILTAIKKLPRK